MGFKCKNCGSNVKYNIDAKRLQCESCGSCFMVDQYKTSLENNISYGVYSCKSCGATLLGLDEEQTAYCTYCGTQTYLAQKTNETDSPKKIVPFKVSKEKVKEIYQSTISGQWFLPKEFQDANFIDEFRGIYIPYWQTSVDIDESEFSLKGIKSYTRGGYDYQEEYDIGVKISGNLVTGQYDASRAFDDNIAQSIAPYQMGDLEEFKEGFLAGFYADKANVPNEIYMGQGEDIAKKGLSKKLNQLVGMNIINDDWKKKIRCEEKSDGIILLPVWFLTWRKNNRVAYSVVNGQTGNITTDLPVDYAQFFKAAAIGTIILFLIFSIFPIFVLPLRLAGISTILLWIATYIMACEMKKIKQMEKHDFDYGYTGKIVKKRKASKALSVITKIVVWFLIFVAASIAIESEIPSDLADVTTIMTFMQLIITIPMIINGLRIQNKIVIIPAVVSIIVAFVSNGIALREDPHDYVNYIITFMNLAVMSINAVTSMYYINDLTTRPVPNFFNREGANHKYEND